MTDVPLDTEKPLMEDSMSAAMTVSHVLREKCPMLQRRKATSRESERLQMLVKVGMSKGDRDLFTCDGIGSRGEVVEEQAEKSVDTSSTLVGSNGERMPEDSDSCHRCPDEEWPDERKVRCVPKTYDFLSYEKDNVALISPVTASSFSAVTLFILGNFIYYWNTPIVKANNRAVSFILLVSILLSFLCVFLFLGQPVDVTCRLRQMSFGIFFSTAVSSVLAKTVTVCIAFKATKPGSPWKKWVTLKVSNYVVIVCSSVQALICAMWLSVSPPYHEYDHNSYQGMIIIQCNEGSVIWFYSVLGYMGILAAVSFVLAFMVRTLPDSFNEAKYITFSMLVFCSVWIAMIPAYLSTKGKDAVAVEKFAILTSCAGVLGCIFFPKLYILLFRTDLISRKMMLGKN
ncbi:vomeronasal type-2 receptor 26-like [Pseudophryne corroboree]|uniref:vomeronasal type-2 receptor 26-like n=1 Tax=Pseudophryne corroboree TaxID=495146 RepID=UPI00308132B3